MRDEVTCLRSLSSTCHAIALMLRAGLTPDRALQAGGVAPGGWGHSAPHQMVADIWEFSLERGLAPATVMVQLAAFIATIADCQREVQLQGVGPRAASRLILWLPAVSVLLASASGFAVMPFLLGSVLGWVLMVLAALLMGCARWWSRRLMLRSSCSSWAVGMPAAVVAQCLRAGIAPPLPGEVARLIPREGYVTPADGETDLARAYITVERSQEWGVPAAALLDAEAELAQRRESERLREAGEKLAVSILIPLGVCILPAFIAVGVVPIVVVMLSSTPLS